MFTVIFMVNRVRTVHEKNGSDSVPDFMSSILADLGPDSIFYQAGPPRPHILV